MKNLALIILTTITIMSCSTSHETFWVSGVKSQCDAGAGKSMCLNVYKGNSLDQAEWQQFYSPIEGFEFKEGVVQKVKVKVEKVSANDMPADGSSKKYSLDKVVESEPDKSAALNGDWLLATINNEPVNRMTKLPNANFNLSNKILSGFDGCNQYTTMIENVNSYHMNLGVIRATKKLCQDMQVPDAFSKALSTVSSYVVKDDQLVLMDANKNSVLTFIMGMDQSDKTNDGINNEWVAVRINGNPINRKVTAPRILISSSKKMVIGNNGCNTFNANIVNIDATQINIRNATIDDKACNDMEVATAFNQALLRSYSYQVNGDTLTILDAHGDEVLAFIVASNKTLSNNF